MTHRLYYTDAYTTRFTAQLVETTYYNQLPAVVLDQSYFYPTSGGQPNDRGKLQSGDQIVEVLDVVVRAEDQAVLHILDRELRPNRSSEPLVGELDWSRRFDHMQQHTGQHILSQAFIRLVEAETVGFHLSDKRVTIDLDHANLSDADLEAAEMMCNDIIWHNRPVTFREVEREAAQQLPLRKLPDGREGKIRLIDVEGFDLTACGGTHVSQTGEIGLLKIVKRERRNEQTRVEFCCGRRALLDYRLKNDVVQQLAVALTTGYEELLPSVNRLQENAKELQRQLRQLQAEQLALEATHLLTNGERVGEFVLVTHVYDGRAANELRALATQLTATPGSICFLASAGARSDLVFARAADAPGDMKALLQIALGQLDGARGGGSATLAQGSGAATGAEQARAAVDRAVAALKID
jgi:alanyl-tRNA synthetase